MDMVLDCQEMRAFFFFKLSKIRYFLWKLIELKLFFGVSWIIEELSRSFSNAFQLEGVDEQWERCAEAPGINREGSMKV